MYPAICSFSAREDLLAQIVRFLLREPAIGALTGEAGSGKSTLLEQVSNQLWSRARVLSLFPPAKNGDLYQQLASQLGIDPGPLEGNTSGESTAKRVGQCLEKPDPAKPTVVLCDDADQYPITELEQLRLLSNYPLCILLCGEDVLFKRLRHRVMGPLQQRISAFFRMPRLSWKVTPAFLQCAVRGNPGGSPNQPRVPEEVAKRLFKLSGGLPGTMMELVDGALISASYRGDPVIRLADIPRGHGMAVHRKHSWAPIPGLFAGALVMGAAAALYFTPWNNPGAYPPEPVERISFKMDQVPFPEWPSAPPESQDAAPEPALDLIFQSDAEAEKFLFPNPDPSPSGPHRQNP